MGHSCRTLVGHSCGTLVGHSAGHSWGATVQGNGGTIVDKGVDRFMLGKLEVLGFRVVHLEEQKKRSPTGQLAERKLRVAFQDVGTYDRAVVWSAGPPVRRSAGPLVRWSAGPLVHWSAGPPACWFASLLVRWSAGPPVRWSAGSPVRRSAGPPVRWSAGPLVRWSAVRCSPPLMDALVQWSGLRFQWSINWTWKDFFVLQTATLGSV